MTPTQDGLLTSAEWTACTASDPELTAQCWTEKPPGSDYERFNAAFYSLDVFLPLVELEQELYWSPAAERGGAFLGISVGSWAWGYRIFHELLGYILSGFAIVGFTKLAERD